MGGATPVRASSCASAWMLCVVTGAKVTVAELLGGLGAGRVRGVANLRKRLATSGHAQHQLRPPPGKPQTEKVRREGGRKWGQRERGREGRREGGKEEVGTKGKREGGREGGEHSGGGLHVPCRHSVLWPTPWPGGRLAGGCRL